MSLLFGLYFQKVPLTPTSKIALKLVGCCLIFASRARKAELVSPYAPAAPSPQCSSGSSVIYATVCRDLTVRWTYSTQNEFPFLSSVCAVKRRAWAMSSYASYCQDQATDCARRARLASSPEVVAYCRSLEFRWLKLAKKAQETGGALGRESGLAATMLPLHDKIAAYPVEYGKRAGELIALLRLVR
jgi:hypothetical protein